MKSYQVLLALLCINYIYSEAPTCMDVEKPTKEACNAALTDEDKKDGYMYCCYAKFKYSGYEKEEAECVPFTEYRYKNIDDFIKYIKLMEFKSDDLSIDCSSNFFKFSFLSLILLLL